MAEERPLDFLVLYEQLPGWGVGLNVDEERRNRLHITTLTVDVVSVRLHTAILGL